MDKRKDILQDSEFNSERISIAKKLLDDLKYEGFHKTVYLKSTSDTITVFLQPHNKFMEETLARSLLATSLRDNLYLRADIALLELSSVLPIDKLLIIEYSLMNIKIRGVDIPMVGVRLKREAEVFNTVTSLFSFYKTIMRSIESQYLKSVDSS